MNAYLRKLLREGKHTPGSGHVMAKMIQGGRYLNQQQ